MVDVDPFLTTLYVMVDDFCTRSLPPEPHPGPQAALSRSEGVTLALFGPWQGFGSERGFYRSAQRHLRAAFPPLPTWEQYNRQVRQPQTAPVTFFLALVHLLAVQRCAYEALDSSGGPTRDAQRPWRRLAARTGKFMRFHTKRLRFEWWVQPSQYPKRACLHNPVVVQAQRLNS